MCAVIGGLQTYLLSIVLKSALNGDIKSAALALLGKFVCYGIAFALLWFFFMESVLYAAVGFIVGVVMSIIVIAIRSFRNKSDEGDDLNEHGRAD